MSSELESNFEPTAFFELQRTLRKSLGRRTHALDLTEADSFSRSGFIEQIPAKGERERVDVRREGKQKALACFWLLRLRRLNTVIKRVERAFAAAGRLGICSWAHICLVAASRWEEVLRLESIESARR